MKHGLLWAVLAPATLVAQQLPSWNDAATKAAIVGFVERVTKEGSPDFVPAAERIAVFDNDGALWGEQPMYFQFLFVLDRIKELAPVLVRLPEVDFVDDKEGKPVGIWRHIGKKPILAVANSDGDFQMLEWTTSGARTSLAVLVHHDDGKREFAYDRESHVGRLVRGFDEGPKRGWTIVSMKDDWKSVFAPQ